MASRKTQERLAKSVKAEKDAQQAVADAGIPVVEVNEKRETEDIISALAKATERRDAREERMVAALERIAAALEAHAPQEVNVSPPPPPQADAPQELPGSPPVKPSKANGKVDLKAAQQAFLDALAKDRESTVRVLKGFGVERVSALPPEKYADFIKAVQA